MDITLTHAQLVSWAGRPLSDDDVARLAEALSFSTLPEVIGDLIFAFDLQDEDEDF